MQANSWEVSFGMVSLLPPSPIVEKRPVVEVVKFTDLGTRKRDMILNLFSQGYVDSEIAQGLGISLRNVRRHLQAHGKIETRQYEEAPLPRYKGPIVQVSIEGKLIEILKNRRKACEKLGIDPKNMSMVYNRKDNRRVASGFIFMKIDDWNGFKDLSPAEIAKAWLGETGVKKRKSTNPRQVVQLTLAGEHKMTFASLNAASREVGCAQSWMSSACTDGTVVKGHQFMYRDEWEKLK